LGLAAGIQRIVITVQAKESSSSIMGLPFSGWIPDFAGRAVFVDD
jgi:hypothetical protein